METEVKGFEEALERAAGLILSAEYVVALTGAGISVESGIPPFRGPGGLWTKYGEPSMNGYRKFLADPKKWWIEGTKRKRRRGLGNSISAAKPNPGHYALAKLEEMNVLKTLITQNIDNLHISAGNQNVVEIHGNSHKLRCIKCGSRFPRDKFDLSELPPTCPECKGIVKRDTVMFGEPIPHDVLERSVEETRRCDCMLIIGTSATVHPAASFPLHVRRNGGTLIEINPLQSDVSSLCDVCIRAPSGIALPKLVQILVHARNSF
jgi:NAD-dependent deacetylase